MNAIAIGPLAFSGDRFSVIIGLFAFMIVGSVLSAYVERRLGPWTTTTVMAGLIGARLAYVAAHLDSFLQEPWRILAIWQGGFSWIGGTIGVGLAMIFLARRAWATLPWAAASLFAGLFVWIVSSGLMSANVAPGAPATSFARLDGTGPVAIAERGGRPAVLNLWATWCPPCRREMPMMAQMAKDNPHVDFIFANQGEGSATIETYLRQAGIELETVLLDPFSALSRHYAALGLPATLFIHPDGRLTTSHLGEISREALAEKLASISQTIRTRTE